MTPSRVRRRRGGRGLARDGHATGFVSEEFTIRGVTLVARLRRDATGDCQPLPTLTPEPNDTRSPSPSPSASPAAPPSPSPTGP